MKLTGMEKRRLRELLDDDQLFDPQPVAHDFDGDTYEPAQDKHRLNCQLRRVFDLMRDGKWRTLDVIAYQVSGSEAAISARLRDFRKPRFGAHTVERRRVKCGLFEYRLLANGDLR